MLRDAIYGFAVGDALGVPFEFKKRGTFRCTGMVGNGAWNQPSGTWSDDTSMLLATLDSIKECGKIDIKDMRARFIDWASKGKYTANGDTFDIGYTTFEALRAGKGINDINANGNGALMRILPIAFIAHNINDIHEVSAITHAHSISKIACEIYIDIAAALVQGDSIKQAIKDALLYYDTPEFERLYSIWTLPEEEIKSSGYVVDTLEAALWCLCNTDNYTDAVLKAVNLGSDTDTVAAITGGLAGIIYGYDSIPKIWIEKLKNKKLIDLILNK